MDCNYTTIKTCELKGSTFRSRMLDFGDFDISDYSFSVGFVNSLGHKISEHTLDKVVNKVVVPLTYIEDQTGRIRADVWMEREGGFKDLVVVFDVGISTSGCPDDSSVTDAISVTFGGMKVPITVTQSIVNINLSWEDLTPEQILELQQPAIDAALIANNAADSANNAAQTANTAAQNADEKATAAQTAANNANDATSAANTATTNANNATNAANTATTNANNATLAANTAATNAQDEADAAQQISNDIQLAENTRISNENTRQNQESTRQTNESGRVNTENTRVSNESSRVTAENTRVSAENTRVSNETTRQNQEGTRQTNETTRINAESARVLAENSRVSAESARVTAEATRQWRIKELNDFSLNGYYNSVGSLTANAGYSSTPLYRAKAGMKFKNPFLGTTTFRQIAFYDINRNNISTAFGEAENTAPANTHYVAFSRTAGSTAPVSVQSDFWALQQEDFYTEFTFNSNPEKIISAVDIATDTFTSVAHGMANGTEVCITKNQTLAENTNPVALIPGGLLIERYFVINATADTFQLSKTAGGAAIDIVTNATMNLSKIHLEILAAKIITVSGLPNSYGWRVIAKINSTTIINGAVSIRGTNFSHTQRWINTMSNTLGWTDVVFGAQSEFYVNTVLQQIAGRNIISSKGMAVNYTSATTMAVSKIDSELMDSIYTVPTFINGVTIANTNAAFYVLNGSKIEIYKL